MKKILYTMILACSTMMVSCDSWLEVKPYDKISEGELQKSEEGYQKMLNGIYIDLNSDALYGQSLSVEMIEVMGGAYAIGTDNSVWGNYKDLSNYQYGTEYWRNRLDQTWNKAYALILNCNKILENIDQNQDLFTGGNYYAVKGEALALRAMLHFDMLRLFGPVYAKDSDKKAIPYYNKQTNSPEPILTAKEVAEKVVADLEEARILLANDPVKTEGTLMSGSQDGTSNFMRYRALRLNYYAVEALLARVNLYMGNKTEAFKYATDVIKTADQGIFPFVDKSLVIGSPADPDRIFSSEVLFALTNTSRSKIHKNFYDPSRLPNYVFRMDDNLMSNIVYGGAATTGGYQDDYRYRANWIATGSNRYFYKYSDMVANGSIQNTMIPMIRLGEMFLIAAESQSDNLANGVQYVNALRRNRGVANLQTLTSDLLKYEYIRELYGEGQLFYLYKRLNSDIITSSNANKNPKASDLIFVVPLPDSETEN
ncbi:RagB/SusD family nutrient uptake outer membrane protein [Segatella copri]|uniref:RagB/SusD family nutrient uptake outer membrane protein n=1 Tax=Segatella copri TaxID=165179 RepID=A0AA90UQE2_9BACT|nr:RagB/SusD family nutrient uptake outer membrane protein [Segatella copri]MQN67944.1 RagB/SusD family nutrient uptake outer membrane protein [Segatella copri]MQN77527.1 RagB/SusD family nutrient uptake outer membrane protein [Segatella copri]MQO02444.1 RagB/SusD family nutrient uptake outer membrane protein [Segatella copri]